jgi:hypothetical protein
LKADGFATDTDTRVHPAEDHELATRTIHLGAGGDDRPNFKPGDRLKHT